MSNRLFFDPLPDPMREFRAGINSSSRHRPADRPTAADSCACGLVTGDAHADVYNEEAFRYFLDIERKRSESSNRPFVLLLVDLTKQSMAPNEIDPPSAQTLLSAMALCVRETDFIGWYRTRSVVGAVLTQHADTAGAELQEAVSRRIAQVLDQRLPADLAQRVRVRVYQLPSAVLSVS
jgi:hypothetical protein